MKIEETIVEEATTEEETPEAVETELSQEDKDFQDWMNDPDDQSADFTDVEEEKEDETESGSEESDDEEPTKSNEEEITEPKEEEKPEPKTWKLKVNGEDVEHDPSNEEQTKELVQRGLSATQTWQEAAKVRKQATDLVETLKSNPRAILENPNLLGREKLTELAEQILLEEYELEGLSESEREYKMKTRQMESEKAEQARQKQVEAQRHRQTKIQQAKESLNKNIAGLLEGNKMPVNAHTMSQVTNVLKQMHGAGMQPNLPEAVKLVRENHVKEEQAKYNALSPEELISLIGQANYDRVREFKLAEVQSKPKATSQTKPKPKVTKKYTSEAQFLREMANKSVKW